MTTSITDARYNVLHHTSAHTLSLSFDEPPETGWSVMPGYDESLAIPPHLEPPRLDADETLPSMLHPSYPFGRPLSLGKKGAAGKGRGVGNLLGTVGDVDGRFSSDSSMGLRSGSGSRSGWGSHGPHGSGDRWEEWGLEDVVERERRKEVPPGMAGAKRPPSPPSPSLRPSHIPLPRSTHLRRLLERQQQATSPPPNDGFDAPVPNETYEEDQSQTQRAQMQHEGEVAGGQQQQAQPQQINNVIAAQMGSGQSRLGRDRGGERENDDIPEADDEFDGEDDL